MSSLHYPGFQTRHDTHVGSIQGASHRLQHRESSQSAHPPLHDRNQSRGLSDRSSVGIHRSESERIRNGTETEEIGRHSADGRRHHRDFSRQQFCPLSLQTDQRPVQ